MGSDVTPAELTKAQARRLTDKIVEAAETTWTLVLEAHDRKAWKPLGYDTWSEYCSTEFGMTDRNARHLLTQGRVVQALESASGSALPPRAISARAAVDVKADLPALSEKVAAAVKNIPKARRPQVVVDVIAEHRAGKVDTPEQEAQPALHDARGTSPSPAGSASARGTQVPSLPEPRTQKEYRRLVALIVTAGAEVLAGSCAPDELLAANRVLVAAHRILAPPKSAVLVAARRPSPRSDKVQSMLKGGN